MRYTFGVPTALRAAIFAACVLALPAEDAKPHWAFQPLRNDTIPAVHNTSWPRNPIDQFVLTRLEEKGIAPSASANNLALLRRAAFDLTGLPPTAAEFEQLLGDSSSEAFENLLVRLLNSPRFGECWGRHWLDWAGYADVLGGDNDAGTVKLGEGKWRYRDYVIDCFNQDRPFDRFICEQLAGDEMIDWRGAGKFTPEIVELLTATTFLRSAADDTDENELNTPDIRHGVLQRTAEVVANNLLAVTLNCAKCHDHKYDPIPQKDYYRFLAYFTPAFDPGHWLQPKDRALPDISKTDKEEIERHNKAIDEAVGALKKRREEIEAPVRNRFFEEKLAKLPEEIRADTKVAIQADAQKRSEVQKYLVEKFQKSLGLTASEISAALGEQNNATIAFFDQEIKRLDGDRKSWRMLQAVYDAGPAPTTHLLLRGNYLTPGEEVQPAFLSALHASLHPLEKSGKQTSGRRLALARLLTDKDSVPSALMARVIMNRIWQQLFGVGIVETSDNFGISGARPTHPELLDWLASEYMRQGWRLKPMLGLIMSSATYQQTSTTSYSAQAERAIKLDPDDKLLWRQRLRRLDSEMVRDALLAVSGNLDLTMKGPPVPTENRPDGMVVVSQKQSGKDRRSVYLLARRNYQLSLLSTFDQPMMSLNCTRRSPSAVVLQSLMMLNDSFVVDQADALATRIAGDADQGEPNAQIERAFQLALARPPSDEEIQWCKSFLQRQTENHRSASSSAGGDSKPARKKALANLCHMLLNSSEFLYLP
jgi:hypothetical protein